MIPVVCSGVAHGDGCCWERKIDSITAKQYWSILDQEGFRFFG
jgi:hypothetical protein